MKRSLPLLVAGVLLAGCSDGNGPADPRDSRVADQRRPDAFAGDFTIPLDTGGATCGPGIYPCGPYGTSIDQVVQNLEFLGFADPQTHCKAIGDHQMDTSKLVRISFQDWHLGDPDPACAAHKKKLLWVVVSAGWCGPCQTEVSQTQKQYAAGAITPGVGVLNIVFETSPPIQPANESFLKTWIKAFNLTFPVVMDPSFKMGAYFAKEAVPFNMLIDTATMKVFYRQTGGDLSNVGKKIQEFLQS